jgi:hypothetical protein
MWSRINSSDPSIVAYTYGHIICESFRAELGAHGESGAAFRRAYVCNLRVRKPPLGILYAEEGEWREPPKSAMRITSCVRPPLPIVSVSHERDKRLEQRLERYKRIP